MKLSTTSYTTPPDVPIPVDRTAILLVRYVCCLIFFFFFCSADFAGIPILLNRLPCAGGIVADLRDVRRTFDRLLTTLSDKTSL